MDDGFQFSSPDDFVQLERVLADAAGATRDVARVVDGLRGWRSDSGWEGAAAEARTHLGSAHDQLSTAAGQCDSLAQRVHDRIALAQAASGQAADTGSSGARGAGTPWSGDTGMGTTDAGGGGAASPRGGQRTTHGSDNPLAGVAGFFAGAASAVGGAAHGATDAVGGAAHGVADAAGSAVHNTLDVAGHAISTVDHGATVAVVGGVAEATGRLGNSVVQAGGDLLGSTGRAVDDFGKRWKANDPAGAVGTALNDVTGGVSTGLQHIEGGEGRAAKALVHGGAMGAIDAASIVGMQGRVAPVVGAGERAVDRVVDNEVRFSQGVTKALGGVVTGLVDVGVWAYHSAPGAPQDRKIWVRQRMENDRFALSVAHHPLTAASIIGQLLVVKPVEDVLSGDPERVGEGATNLVLNAIAFTKLAALAKMAVVTQLGADADVTLGPVAKFGGAYRDVRDFWPEDSGQVHHTPADQVSPLGKDTPALLMDVQDHMDTGSWGRGRWAQAYRDIQRDHIDNGRFLDALEMDIDDLQYKFGSRYNYGIRQMLEYARSIDPDSVGFSGTQIQWEQQIDALLRRVR